MRYGPWLALALISFCNSACSSSGTDDVPASYIRIDLDKSDPERLLAFYLGGYVKPEPNDPFQAGIAASIGNRLYANIDSLEMHFSSAAARLVDADENGRIDWEEFERFIESTYYEARGLPSNATGLRQLVGFDPDDPEWMRVDVHGVMTTARRAVYIRRSAVIDALENYRQNEERLIYPEGTSIIGEHWMEGRLVETTAMIKRDDGFWDYVVYGEDDSLAAATSTPPKELRSPTQCVGCHFGNRLFEPERSFPATPAPGPHGPRTLHVPDSWRDVDVVRFFDEHRKRSDTILGLYGTLFVAQLRAAERVGELTEDERRLLESFNL